MHLGDYCDYKSRRLVGLINRIPFPLNHFRVSLFPFNQNLTLLILSALGKNLPSQHRAVWLCTRMHAHIDIWQLACDGCLRLRSGNRKVYLLIKQNRVRRFDLFFSQSTFEHRFWLTRLWSFFAVLSSSPLHLLSISFTQVLWVLCGFFEFIFIRPTREKAVHCLDLLW